MAIDTMMQFKQSHGGFFGNDLVAMLRDMYLLNIKAVHQDLDDVRSVMLVVRLLESERDIEGWAVYLTQAV